MKTTITLQPGQCVGGEILLFASMDRATQEPDTLAVKIPIVEDTGKKWLLIIEPHNFEIGCTSITIEAA